MDWDPGTAGYCPGVSWPQRLGVAVRQAAAGPPHAAAGPRNAAAAGPRNAAAGPRNPAVGRLPPGPPDGDTAGGSRCGPATRAHTARRVAGSARSRWRELVERERTR